MYHAKRHPESRFSSVILSCLLLLSAGCRDVKQELLDSSYCRCMTEEMKQANCSIPFQFGHELWFGIAEGKKENTRETVRRMKALGLPLETIAQVTQLSFQDIEKM